MILNRFFSHFSYFLVGIVSLLLAVFVSSRIVRPSHSQPSQNPAPAAMPAERASPAAAAPTINTEVSFLEPYVFDMREGRRNPFKPPQLVEGTTTQDVMLPGTPLERFELDELKLVGIMWDVRAPKAMIIDPQGEVHIIGKDDRIGRKRGYIAVIREGEVVIVETTSFNGDNTYSTRVLRIGK